jgi:hypothetical protein
MSREKIMNNWTLQMNRNIRLVAVFLSAFCFLLIFSCDWTVYGSLSDNKSFDYDLRGTWTTNDPGSRYTGTLVITYNTITITGYGENQTPTLGGNDTERPFKGFNKNIALSGYSEEGKIFIKDMGIMQEGIPYTYDGGDYKRIELLRFNFGGKQQTLRKQ